MYWRADSSPDSNYTVFTHLLDTNETVLINADHAPPKPTSGWIPGEIISDSIEFEIDSGLSPGWYDLEIGLYDASDPAYPRLVLDDGSTRVLLTELIRLE
jgi:hypothetical protein